MSPKLKQILETFDKVYGKHGEPMPSEDEVAALQKNMNWCLFRVPASDKENVVLSVDEVLKFAQDQRKKV
jgi:hypothetical protein